ncbi:outer membrane family protein [Helicobacter cetorum]|uniref:outer membrane family protein n=1 Tax=Helicobacter cetorum TaxID=138563 RepID=UPI000CF1BC29|nr:outer membrane family protein [Helicobacter cetorum]
MISLKKTIALSFCLMNIANAFSYKVSGSMAEFSKVGFNNRPINTALGYYPTETFVGITGFLNIKADLLPKNVYNHSFTAKLGVMGGGLAYDGTKTLIDQATGKPFGSMMWMYYGAWHGYYGAGGWGTNAANGINNAGVGGYQGNQWMSQHTHNILLNEAYIEYGYKKIFRFKAGRYAGNAYFMDGYTEGFEATLNLKNFTFWWFSSFGMSWTYDEWIYDYFAPIVTTNKKGKPVNLGIHSGSVTWHKKGLSINPFFYFSPNTYIAPGIQVTYVHNIPLSHRRHLSIYTTAMGFFPYYNPKDAHNIFYSSYAGTSAQMFLFKQKFTINGKYFGYGIYKTWGNANAYTPYTDPELIGFNFWTNTVYDWLSAANMNANAFTFHAKVGGHIRKLSWEILGRVTTSPRANEGAVNLDLAYNFSRFVTASLTLEWYRAWLHHGYQVGQSFSSVYNPAFKATSQDRSFLMTNLHFKF